MFRGKKVILRQGRLSDVDNIMIHWNTLELRKTIAYQLPDSVEHEKDWIRNNWENMRKGQSYHFIITDEEDEFIGTIGLFQVDRINRRAELGIAIHDPQIRGKGYGTDAVITMCAVGFNILNFHSIRLSYLDFNQGAKAYYNAGFTETGRERQAIFRNGTYVDLVNMDILEDEFREKFGDYSLYPA
ncbi:MAG: GNAT family N-acetyltransferase [Candidatus Heimdallarchaeota archaeon]|nr:GNAT family N-acetyltransferase [Candidatus Heimdallarchaeota archaeon]